MKKRDLSRFDNTQYDYATYDGIMVNVYKGLAFLKTGDKASARVEFNRVGDRETRAEREFASEKAQLDAQAQRSARGNFDFNSAMSKAQSSESYRSVQAELGPVHQLSAVHQSRGQLSASRLPAEQCRNRQRSRGGPR